MLETPLQEKQLFVIGDLESLKVIADPLRIQIMESLRFAREGKTVKAIAAGLGLPATKLYYHVNLLEEHGLIYVHHTNLVSGIVEKHYARAARHYTVDPALLVRAQAPDDTLGQLVASIFDASRHDITQRLRAGELDLDEEAPVGRRVSMGRIMMHMTAEEREAFEKRFEALIDEYEGRDEPKPGGRWYTLTLALYPARENEAQEEAKE